MNLRVIFSFFILVNLYSFGQCNASFNSTATSICSGNSINFINTSTGSANYAWKINEVVFSSATNSNYLFSSAGFFMIELVVNNGMGCFDSVSVAITINQTPTVNVNATPTSILLGDSVYVTFPTTGVISGTTYAWSFCDGFNAYYSSPFYYTYTAPGSANCVCVQMDNNNGCVDNDCVNGIVVTYVDGITELEKSAVSIYPNPALGDFVINLSALNNSNITVTIFDSMNRVVRIYKDINESQLMIERDNLEKGIYHIIVETNQERFMLPVIFG